MKKYVLFLLLPLFLFSCNDDEGYSLGDFWISLATVENPERSGYFTLHLDNGDVLWIVATEYPNYRPETGQRIIANFTLLSDRPAGDRYDHDVKLNDAYNILTKGIFNITPETQDSIGNDPVGLRGMWLTGDFLNVEFYYYGQNRAHYISLVRDASEDYGDGKVHLEFRHNNRNDGNSYRRNGIVCFNLSSLQPLASGNTVELVIHVKDYDDENLTRTFTYNIVNKAESDRNFNQDEFEDARTVEIE